MIAALVGLTACSSADNDEPSGLDVIAAHAAEDETDFSQIPSPIPNVEHGSLLKYLPVEVAIKGATTYKIMYASRSIDGKPIVVTGLAVVPDAPVTFNSRIVLTVGHGTTGLGDACAPSIVPPGGLDGVAAAAVANNWIVAATDYEGLGPPGPHPYLVGVSEGRSVLDAALAAAHLPRAQASNKVLIAGYSQGGHAALWANQLARTWTPGLKVLGAFAGAPVTELDRFLAGGRSSSAQTLILAIIAGYSSAYRTVDPARYLTDEGVALLDAARNGCLDEIHASAIRLTPDRLVRPEGPTDAAWLALGRRNNPGGAVGAGPVLIVHSDQDGVVPLDLSRILFERMCAKGQGVQRRVIAAGTHEAAIVPAVLAGLKWLRTRSLNKPFESDCVA